MPFPRVSNSLQTFFLQLVEKRAILATLLISYSCFVRKLDQCIAHPARNHLTLFRCRLSYQPIRDIFSQIHDRSERKAIDGKQRFENPLAHFPVLLSASKTAIE